MKFLTGQSWFLRSKAAGMLTTYFDADGRTSGLRRAYITPGRLSRLGIRHGRGLTQLWVCERIQVARWSASSFLKVGLWRSWERASMAWKRSSVRSRPGPPNLIVSRGTWVTANHRSGMRTEVQKHLKCVVRVWQSRICGYHVVLYTHRSATKKLISEQMTMAARADVTTGALSRSTRQ
jgi:hypothetical protein